MVYNFYTPSPNIKETDEDLDPHQSKRGEDKEKRENKKSNKKMRRIKEKTSAVLILKKSEDPPITNMVEQTGGGIEISPKLTTLSALATTDANIFQSTISIAKAIVVDQTIVDPSMLAYYKS